jgi:hypothetical protein
VLPHARRLSRLLVSAPLVAAAVIPATTAQAAAPAPHLVSQAQARAALPTSSAMPGHPPTVVTSTAGAFANPTVCVGPNTGPVRLKNVHPVTNIYIPAGAKPSFSITALVFHTTAAAKVGLAAILHAEHACPARQSAPDGSVVRTLSAKYGAGSWTGWRSIDHLTIPSDPTDPAPPLALRLATEFLARGNVLLVLTETSTTGQGSGPALEAARKTATTAMLAGFAKL